MSHTNLSQEKHNTLIGTINITNQPTKPELDVKSGNVKDHKRKSPMHNAFNNSVTDDLGFNENVEMNKAYGKDNTTQQHHKDTLRK